METLVLLTTALASFGILVFQERSRAFFVLFLHLLVALTVGSLTLRTLSGGGILLVPFVDGWSRSPLMQLTHVRAYSMMFVSLITVTAFFRIKGRIIWASPQTSPAVHSFTDSRYSCLMVVWIHITIIVSLLLL